MQAQPVSRRFDYSELEKIKERHQLFKIVQCLATIKYIDKIHLNAGLRVHEKYLQKNIDRIFFYLPTRLYIFFL